MSRYFKVSFTAVTDDDGFGGVENNCRYAEGSDGRHLAVPQDASINEVGPPVSSGWYCRVHDPDGGVLFWDSGQIEDFGEKAFNAFYQRMNPPTVWEG